MNHNEFMLLPLVFTHDFTMTDTLLAVTNVVVNNQMFNTKSKMMRFKSNNWKSKQQKNQQQVTSRPTSTTTLYRNQATNQIGKGS